MVRSFEPTDYPALADWYRGHGAPPPALRLLPPVGLIVPAVAAGFIFLTGGAVALLDGYVTNPAAPARARSAAIDEITAELRTQARAVGVEQLICICRSAGIARRAAKLGLRVVSGYMLAEGAA